MGDDTPYGRRLLPQVVDEIALQGPSRTIGMIADPDNPEGFQRLTAGDLAKAVNFTAYWIDKQIGKSSKFETIAYIGIGDFRYWVMELAAMKCGYPLLLLSARNSDVNNISLFGELKCRNIFYVPPFQSKTKALEAIGANAFQVPTFHEMIADSAPVYPYTKSWEEARLDPVAICHTSGSTGAPKPVTYNNAFIGVQDASRRIPGADGRRDGNISIVDGAVYFLGFPAFHLMGVVYGLCSLFYRCVPVLPPPRLPPDGKVITDIMGKVELTQLICPPTLLDDLVKNYRQEFIRRSRLLTYIHNAGGPLSKDTGNFLASKFSIIQIIGSSETAKLPCLVAKGEDWEWYEWNPRVGGVRMERIGGDSDVYELTIERVPGQEWVQAVFYAFPHRDLWRTRDLYRKHPTRNLWIFDGRKDDVIVLNNGEKFNPVTMEITISSHPLVKGALVVGNSYDQVGLLLEVNDPGGDFVEKIWPTVQMANAEAPQHARVYKDMIATSSPEKPFSRAAKGTIQRLVTTQAYKHEIDAMYNCQSDSKLQQPSTDLLPQKHSQQVLIDIVRQGVKFQLERDDFANSDDIYFLGFDSLQTTQLAKRIAENLRLRMPAESRNAISPRLIYDNPSVDKISSALFALLNPELSTKVDPSYHVDQMAFKRIQELVQKYTTGMSPKVKVDNTTLDAQRKPHIAVTGTTGFLGYYLLAKLLNDPEIEHITCLNRSPVAMEKFLRQRSEYAPESPVDQSKLEFIQVSFGEKHFGIQTEKFNQLVDSIDVVIHNAWQVDFNRNLSSFESPHVVGVRTLIDWSLNSPRNMHIVFVSSVSTVAQWPGFRPTVTGNEKVSDGVGESHDMVNMDARPNEVYKASVPELPPTFARIPAKQLGYAQSKYTAEYLLTEAAVTRNVRTTILRPGEISNARATPGPIGSSNDWFALLLLSSKHMKMIPETVTRTATVDFMPVDELADIIGDIVQASFKSPSRETANVFNLVNPNTIHFTDLIPVIEHHFAEAGVDGSDVVPLSKWVEALKQRATGDSDEEAVEKYPALKLKDFYEGLASNPTDEGTKIETANGSRVSKTMREMQPIGSIDIRAWLRDWNI